ncbi:hypothetical protein [Desulforamulus ferrireducens]|uniref:hypothetical protein n=1 Tax=Desulforamulus ferrireducens TaxID=1833852 RepID=UPI001A9A2E61|nr:hypothetical protein [Desulforamulus ferrireducens]
MWKAINSLRQLRCHLPRRGRFWCYRLLGGQFKEFLVVGLPYVELIKLWRAKGMSPEKVKEIWGRILEIKSIL